MAIDRDEALRKAEKLLRRGPLDEAIAEYERIVSGDPGDMAAATSLGDLYGRAGKAQRAVGQFTRIGDHWLREGDHAKTAASFKRVLRLDPQHEPALLQLVEACARQGQIRDAKAHLRRALFASGEDDPDGVIAVRLGFVDMEEEPDVPAPDAPIEAAGARATAAPESTAAAPADDEAVDFEPVEFEAWEVGSIDLTEAVDQLAPGGEVKDARARIERLSRVQA